MNYPFYQEGNFYYLFGVQEPDCYGALEVDSGKTVLFVPKMSNLYKIWMTVLSAEDFKTKYDVDEVVYVEEMSEWLVKRAAEKVYLNAGINSDSGTENILPEEKYWKDLAGIDKETMYEVLAESRVTKTA